MEHDFWHSRWQENRIGFHQDNTSDLLQHYWPQLQIDAARTVLVPLCGKSLDMLWLRERGHRVFGIELSEVAVQAFFSENNLLPDKKQENGMAVWRANGISVACGDFFTLPQVTEYGFTAIYDRASLIALPPEMRPAYASHLAGLAAPGATMMLLTLDYPQQQMAGPPFAVSEDEVVSLFAEHFEISTLASRNALDENPRFGSRGLETLTEKAYRLTRTQDKP